MKVDIGLKRVHSKYLNSKNNVNPFIHNVEKWPNILLKSFLVNTARFLKYIWPFFNIMNERVNGEDEKLRKSGKLPLALFQISLVVFL